MAKKLLYWLIASTALLMTTQSFAADICTARARVNAIDVDTEGERQPEQTDYIHQGDVIDAVTQYGINQKTGAGFICSHGGGCYSVRIGSDGLHGDDIDLMNCKVDFAKPNVSDGVEWHELIVIRSKNSPARLRQDDIEDRLLELGACTACASTMANTYIRKPKSKCGQFTKAVLEGNKDAVKQVSDGDMPACGF